MENKITVSVTGASRVELVNNLRAFADNLDGTPSDTEGKVVSKTTRKVAPVPAKKTAAPVDEEVADEDDDFKADDSDGEPEGFDDDSADEEPPAPKATAKKSAKAKKLTIDDVNDACKAHAAAKGRPATLAILQKKFKTQSVTALKPEQFEACISAMAVN